MRCKFALAVTIMAWTIVACNPSTPLPTPSPTPSPTQTLLPTPTVTTLPWPTHAPLPTSTPVPTFCPMAAVIVRACIDDDDSGTCEDPEPPIYAEVWLGYDIGVQTPIYSVVETGAGGLGVAIVTPGMYTVVLKDYDAQGRRIVPDYRQTVAIVVNAGHTLTLHVPFISVDPLPTPTPGTPTPTPAPTPYACREYQTMCRTSCDGSFVVDPQGRCGANFLCCMVAPTRTPGATP